MWSNPDIWHIPGTASRQRTIIKPFRPRKTMINPTKNICCLTSFRPGRSCGSRARLSSVSKNLDMAREFFHGLLGQSTGMEARRSPWRPWASKIQILNHTNKVYIIFHSKNSTWQGMVKAVAARLPGLKEPTPEVSEVRGHSGANSVKKGLIWMFKDNFCIYRTRAFEWYQKHCSKSAQKGLARLSKLRAKSAHTVRPISRP